MSSCPHTEAFCLHAQSNTTRKLPTVEITSVDKKKVRNVQMSTNRAMKLKLQLESNIMPTNTAGLINKTVKLVLWH